MKIYIMTFLIIQIGIWMAGNIFKMKNKLVPEMILILTFILAEIAYKL